MIITKGTEIGNLVVEYSSLQKSLQGRVLGYMKALGELQAEESTGNAKVGF